MSEELHLVTELAIILIAAGVFTVISKALKQPLILGYIVAGFIVGPSLGLFPQFSAESVHEWSEIGIIFLLFNLGLEFSFKKLMSVGSAALITAGTICVGMIIVGIATGTAMGWSMMESVFLGGLLSMSSTTIIIKAYDDMGLKQKPYATLIFGTLVVEDLIAVLLMVLLSTLAISNKFAGGEMLFGLGKLVFCLILWFLVGIYVIPTLLKKARKYLSDEILLLVSIGLCFLMVVVANLAGFSSALGAFVMGSILASTMEGERIEGLTVHIKNLFGAIFFVSVGMMVDPAVIAQHWAPILIIALVAVCGILLFSTSGVLIAGKGLDTALHVGFSLAQLGEFSFIIAGLGCTLGVMRDFIYPVIIAVSVITTFTTPYMIKAADPVAGWLRKKLPASILSRIDPPQCVQVVTNTAEQSEWRKLIKNLAVRVGLYGVILIAIFLGSRLYLNKLVDIVLPNGSETLHGVVETVVTLAVMFPFLYGMAVNGGSLKASAVKLMRQNDNNKWSILSIIFLRIFIAVAFVMMVIMDHFTLAGWTILLIAAGAVLFLLFARGSVHKFTKLEDRFLSNFNEKEAYERSRTPVTTEVKDKLLGYDVHIEPVTMPQDSPYIGRKLREMPFRHTCGVNILKIVRGTKSIVIPSGDEVVYPGDVLLAVGTGDQIKAFVQSMQDMCASEEQQPDPEFVVEAVTLEAESNLAGVSLRDADMRSSGCMVISVMHDGTLVTNPRPDYVFAAGDTVWIAGEKSAVEWYR